MLFTVLICWYIICHHIGLANNPRSIYGLACVAALAVGDRWGGERLQSPIGIFRTVL